MIMFGTKQNKRRTCEHLDMLDLIAISEKVNFKSQILVHEYLTILDHFCIPVLFASECHQHENVNITFLGNTGTPEMFQYTFS